MSHTSSLLFGYQAKCGFLLEASAHYMYNIYVNNIYIYLYYKYVLNAYMYIVTCIISLS